MGDLADARILAQLAAKHPDRRRDMPSTHAEFGVLDPVDIKVDCGAELGKLRRNVTEGPDGERNEYLTSLLFCAEYSHIDAQSALKRFNWFAGELINDRLPLWFNWAQLAVKLAAPCKKAPPSPLPADYVPDVRPVGMGAARVKVILGAVWEQFRGAAVEYLAPLQVGVGVPAGIDIAFTKIRLLLECHPEWALMSLDIANMFNEICRKAGIQAFADVPSLRPLVVPLLVLLGPKAHLVVGGKVMQGARSESGIAQGSKWGSLFASVSIHKHVLALKADLVSRGGGDVVSIMDDGYVMGKPEDVYWAVGRFKTAIKKELDCDLQLPKCQIYHPTLDLTDRPEGVQIAEDGDGDRGILVAQVPLGSDLFVERVVRARADRGLSSKKKTLCLCSPPYACTPHGRRSTTVFRPRWSTTTSTSRSGGRRPSGGTAGRGARRRGSSTAGRGRRTTPSPGGGTTRSGTTRLAGEAGSRLGEMNPLNNMTSRN
jgi:hypothetical protein